MKYIALLGVSLTIFTFFSCEKAVFEKDFASKDPETNFEYLWKECSEKYAFFELKGINWDHIKTQYKAKIYAEMSDDSLFNVLGGMLNELKDDHTNLISNFNVSRYNVAGRHQDNFEWRVVQDHYLSSTPYVSGPFIHDFLADGQIGYVRFSAFTGAVASANMDFILNRYKNSKGLILDLRENGGGAVTDVFALMSRFVEEKTLVIYSRVKNGPGINDFSEPIEVYLEPNDGVRYTQKVMLLTDRGTYSAGSFTSLITKALPNVVMVGDTTGGGLGVPNGGQLPNGWTYRFSITQALTLDKKPDYEQGVPPDIHVQITPGDLTKDAILDRAILELL